MEKLKSALAFAGILSTADIEILVDLFKYRKLKSEEHIEDFGKLSHEIVFVCSGVLRAYSIDGNRNEVTKYFIKENQFFANLESHYSSQPSTVAIQCVVASEVYTIPFSLFEKQFERFPNLFIFFKSVTESTLLNKIKDNDFLNFGDSKTKYMEFLLRYKVLAQTVPQKYIASYLKITPQSLSRIRNEVAKGGK
ncbi:MAG: Crp/Fnr family transcriptional regulator [Galbibacter orientalis]|uniref:Crp/Fnr family transcriptional regulator n=1 Tax=Galbibacter orientalis TaxID=453852 RepID=UPI0030026EEC